MKPEKALRAALAVLLAAALLLGAAGAEKWQAAEKNIPRFRTLLDLLGDSVAKPLNTASAEAVLEEIRTESEADYGIGRAILDHWESAVLDPGYRLYRWNGEEKAEELENSGLDFSGKHAFVVLGYELNGGKMAAELIGRCDAAAAAARSFPDSILVCTGGATGEENPTRHTEAGEMKKYLAQECGIDPGRIFTDPKAMNTLDNAVNSMRILKEQGIESMTLVTSDYHQHWGQILFNAVAAVYAETAGIRIRIVGNYNYPTRPEGSTLRYRFGLGQLWSMINRTIDTGD